MKHVALIFFTMVFLIAGALNAAAQSLDLSPAEAWEKINNGAFVLDVRTPDEFKAGHLKGSSNIPYDELETRTAELPAEKDREMVIYCASGRRASKAKATLMSLGYTRLFNAGGYDELSTSSEK